MIFHFAVFFWTLVFLLGLEVIAVNPIFPAWNWYFFSIAPLVVVSLVASKRLTDRFKDAFLPSLLSLTAPMLLSLIDHPTERQMFVAVSTLMYYFALLGIFRLRNAPEDKTAQAFLNSAAVAGMFFFFTGIYGFYLNFEVPLWSLMLLCFLGTSLVSYETLVPIERRKDETQLHIYSLLLGLMMGELVWVMSFWPFGYLTTGAVLLIFYYILWDVAFDAFRKKLSFKRAVFRLIFFLGLVFLLIFSSPWRILV